MPQNPKSKIRNPKSKIRNPKSKIQNPKSKIQNPKSEIQNPKLGHRGPHKKNCYLTIQNPKSKIPKIRPKKFGFWILDFCSFWILDSGFWILDSGFLILDLGFWILRGSRECTTRQSSDGAPWSEARIPPGPPWQSVWTSFFLPAWQKLLDKLVREIPLAFSFCFVKWSWEPEASTSLQLNETQKKPS